MGSCCDLCGLERGALAGVWACGLECPAYGNQPIAQSSAAADRAAPAVWNSRQFAGGGSVPETSWARMAPDALVPIGGRAGRGARGDEPPPSVLAHRRQALACVSEGGKAFRKPRAVGPQRVVITASVARAAHLGHSHAYRNDFRTTSFRPDHVASTAHTLMSTKPSGRANSRTLSSVISVPTFAVFFGHDTHTALSGFSVAR
jgi:hypothetical protein